MVGSVEMPTVKMEGTSILDILARKRALQVDGDGNGRQIEIGIRLHERPDKRRAAVDTLRAAVVSFFIRADFTEDDHDLIGRALLVARDEHQEHHEQHEHHDYDEYDDKRLHISLLIFDLSFVTLLCV